MNEKERENYKLACELKDLASQWFNRTFNQIDVAVFKKLTDDCLFEHIRPIKLDSDDIENFINYSKEDSIIEDMKQELKEAGLEEGTKEATEYIIEEFEAELSIYLEENNSRENYPMWNTCFELKSNLDDDILDLGQEVGLGVIEALDYFNLNGALFAMSCGHSFYSAYWIPLYLKAMKGSESIKKFKNVKFDMV